jgi:hypothetical protein
MPQVSCPGCQTLLSLDPRHGNEFECPTCGQVLRLKLPKPAALSKPRPIPTDDVRRLEEPEPIRRKKKKRRGPSGEVSPLLVPLGGVAVLGLIGLSLFNVQRQAKLQNVEADGLAYVITFVAAIIGISIGGLVTRYSVNSLSKRSRVPELEFAEAVCLYPLVAGVGVIGCILAVLPVVAMFAGGQDQGPLDDKNTTSKFLFGFFAGVLGFVGAGSATVKCLLNTRWNDAASICARFIVVFFLTAVAINMTLAAVIAALRG